MWVAFVTLLGAWLHGTGLYSGAIWAIVYGLLGGALPAAVVIFLLTRHSDQTAATAVLGLTLALVLGAILGPTLPAFHQSMGLNSMPVVIAPNSLAQQRPASPVYAEMHGRLLQNLTIEDVFLTRLSSGNNPAQANRVYHTPLVGPNWQPGDPVRVVITAPPEAWATLPTDTDGLKIVTGVLYPVVPQGSEPAWPNAQAGIGSVGWYQSKAKFNFVPDQLFILDNTTPFRMRLPFYIMVVVLIVAAVIVAFAIRRVQSRTG